jgi:hypothetical protein
LRFSPVARAIPRSTASAIRGRNSAADDRVDGTHAEGAFYGVHPFELRCHFTELVGTHRRPRGGELQLQACACWVVGGCGKLHF